MNFKFNIYDGIAEEDGTTTISQSEAENQQVLDNSTSRRRKEFIPRTPDSAKVQRGERGALVQKMVAALREQIDNSREVALPDSGEVIQSETVNTDLYGIDPEIKDILNSFGIFFFNQIPNYIITTYGSLLSSRGEDEGYQRLIETNLSNEDYFDFFAEQVPLLSQEEIA